jgi:hypothetical protein
MSNKTSEYKTIKNYFQKESTADQGGLPRGPVRL